MKIYLASSWRNAYQPEIVEALRYFGCEVYDFRHPRPDDNGFSWGDVARGWQDWSTQAYNEALQHPVARAGFQNDFDAMQWADACVLLLPCGRSAHLEAGWFVGAGKPVYIYLPQDLDASLSIEPELMYAMTGGGVIPSLADLVRKLSPDGRLPMVERIDRQIEGGAA